MRATTLRAFRSVSLRLQQQSNATPPANVQEYIHYPEFVNQSSRRRLVNTASTEEGSTSSSYLDINDAAAEAEIEGEGEDGDGGVGGEGRTRRSLAAREGSTRIGMVELPLELQMQVNRLIEGTGLFPCVVILSDG